MKKKYMDRKHKKELKRKAKKKTFRQMIDYTKKKKSERKNIMNKLRIERS